MKTPRIFLISLIVILITSSCKIPILSWLQGDDSQPVETEITEGDTSTSDETEDTERLIPHNTDGADVTYISGATYLMGSLDTDTLADDDEMPQHQVEINEFFIYTHEVTNQMYAKCVEAGDCLRPRTQDAGPTSHYDDPEYAEYPVVGVDWVMARDYCAWASVRLPTEAEWELVSRGPNSLTYPWGEIEPSCDYVNMKGCYDPPDTQEIGYYLLGNSPDEVWDMSGNVWEWVQDWYGEDYYNFSPQYNPIGPYEPADPDNPLRVIRGGGLNSEPGNIRSAARKGLDPYRTFIDVGFRCVVGEDLAFPPGYDHGEDRHDDVPPDNADGLTSVRMFAGCRTTEIVDLGILVDPPDAPFTGASTSDGPLTCAPHPPPAGAYRCTDIPGTPGVDFDVDVSFGDGSVIIVTITYPDCDVPLRIEHECVEDETGTLIPHLILFYPPGGPVLVGAAAEAPPDPAVDLDCIVTAPGVANCHGLPGIPGATLLGIFAAFDDGSTLSTTYPHPLCLDAEGLIPPWDILLSCVAHGDGTAEYRAAIDTNMAGWIFLPGSWTFTGVPIIPEPKNCILEDPVLNTWGCNFPIGVYGDIEFCAEWVDGPGLHCVTYDVSGILPPDCSRPPDDDDDGDPEMGWCRPGPPPSNCTGPCLPICPTGVNCNPCTIP